MSDKYDFSDFDEAPKGNDEFDFSDFDNEPAEMSSEITEPEAKIGKGESALKGAQQGLTFGFADEIGAGIETGLDKTQMLLNKLGLASESPSQVSERMKNEGFTGDIPENSYQDTLQDKRKEFKDAEEANPGSYFAGELGAGLLIPGGATTNALKTGGKLAKTAKLAGIGAAAGGAIGAGQAESNDELLGKTIEGATAGAVGNAIIPGAAKLGGKVIKGTGKAIRDIGVVDDFVRAMKHGAKGNVVAGKEAAAKIGQESVDTSREIGGELSAYGSRLGREQAELIDNSSAEINLMEYQKQLKGIKDDVTGLTSATKRDLSEIDTVADNMKTQYGIGDDTVSGLVNDMKSLDPSISDKELRKLIGEASDDFGMPVDARGAKKTIDQLKGLSSKNAAGEGTQLATNETQRAVRQTEKGLRQELSDSVPGLAQKNSEIAGYNDITKSLGLDKVNAEFMDAKDEQAIMNKIMTLITNESKSNKSGSIATDSINRLEASLEKQNPELAKKIAPKLRDLADRFDLSQKSIKESAGMAATIGAQSVKAGQVVGNFARESRVPQITKGIKNLSKMGSEGLEEMANLLNYKFGNKSTKLGNQLRKMAGTKNARQRQAISFSLMQQPSYRRMLGFSPEEEEN